MFDIANHQGNMNQNQSALTSRLSEWLRFKVSIGKVVEKLALFWLFIPIKCVNCISVKLLPKTCMTYSAVSFHSWYVNFIFLSFPYCSVFINFQWATFERFSSIFPILCLLSFSLICVFFININSLCPLGFILSSPSFLNGSLQFFIFSLPSFLSLGYKFPLGTTSASLEEFSFIPHLYYHSLQYFLIFKFIPDWSTVLEGCFLTFPNRDGCPIFIY